MVARDQQEDVLITVFLHDEVFEQKTKLILLSLFNVMVSQQSLSNPRKFNDINPPDNINMNYINLLLQKKTGTKLVVKRKSVALYCCCSRPSFLLSEERNEKLKNEKMVECSGCNKWKFYKWWCCNNFK
jgi:hypothetical protein